MKIFVENKALSYTLAQEIIKRHPYTLISSYEDFSWEIKSYPELISLGKKRIFIMPYKGNFFRKCPGTKNYFCCGYKIFHFAEGCPSDCTYCILQFYFNRPGIKIWANLVEDGLPELERVLKEHKKREKF